MLFTGVMRAKVEMCRDDERRLKRMETHETCGFGWCCGSSECCWHGGRENEGDGESELHGILVILGWMEE